MRRIILALAALAAGGAAALGQSGWRTYANERFGTTVDYPSVFDQRDRPPDNNDGQAFRTSDGRARLLVWGFYNGEGQTTRQIMASHREGGTTYTYADATETWFVLSGIRGRNITYERCAMGGDTIVGCFEIEYPQAEAASWDGIVGRIGTSLRFGPHW